MTEPGNQWAGWFLHVSVCFIRAVSHNQIFLYLHFIGSLELQLSDGTKWAQHLDFTGGRCMLSCTAGLSDGVKCGLLPCNAWHPPSPPVRPVRVCLGWRVWGRGWVNGRFSIRAKVTSGKKERKKKKNKKEPGSSARGSAQLPQTIRQQSTKKWKKENRRNMYFIVFLNRLWGKGRVWKAALICQELWPRQAEQCNAYRAVAVEKGWGGRGGGVNDGKQTPLPVFLSVLFPSQLDQDVEGCTCECVNWEVPWCSQSREVCWFLKIPLILLDDMQIQAGPRLLFQVNFKHHGETCVFVGVSTLTQTSVSLQIPFLLLLCCETLEAFQICNSA